MSSSSSPSTSSACSGDLLRIEFLQSLWENADYSLDYLNGPRDMDVTFAELNVWFSNREANGECIDILKYVFSQQETSPRQKVMLRDFANAYSTRLCAYSEKLRKLHSQIFSLHNVLDNAKAFITETSDISINETTQTIPSLVINLKKLEFSEECSFFLNPATRFQVEIGTDKHSKSFSIEHISSANDCIRKVFFCIQSNNAKIRLKPSQRPITVKLFSLSESNRSQIASATIDPFSLISLESSQVERKLKVQLFSDSPDSCNQTAVILSLTSNLLDIAPEKTSAWIQITARTRVIDVNSKLRSKMSKSRKTLRVMRSMIRPFESLRLDSDFEDFRFKLE